MKYAIAIVIGLIVLGIAGVGLIRLLMPVVARRNGTDSPDFRMTIDDIFELKQSGSAVVVGIVSTGTVTVGDTLMVDAGTAKFVVQVKGIERGLSNPVQLAKAGDKVGIMLSGVNKDQISPGDLLRKH
jgi:selenocysteine-specific translation elongation factor